MVCTRARARGGRNEAKAAKTLTPGGEGAIYYLLADPRLAEAHDSGTVEPLTGAAHSTPQTLPDSNLPHAQNLSGEVEGGRKRAASDTSSSSSNSRGHTNIQATLQKRRRQSGRLDDVMERHRHWTVSGVPGAGAEGGAQEEALRYGRPEM